MIIHRPLDSEPGKDENSSFLDQFKNYSDFGIPLKNSNYLTQITLI